LALSVARYATTLFLYGFADNFEKTHQALFTSLIVCANCLQKSQILKRKTQKAKQAFLTPTASKKSQISQIWCQKSQSGNPAVERKAVSILGQP